MSIFDTIYMETICIDSICSASEQNVHKLIGKFQFLVIHLVY